MEFQNSYRLGLYEKAIPQDIGWRERLHVAKVAGFEYMEMSIDETEYRMKRLDWDDRKIAELRQLQEEEGFFIETMCLSAQRKFPLGSQKWESEANELLKKAILFGKKMGIRFIMLQGYDCYYEEISNETSRLRFSKNLRKAVNFAASHGVMLAIETMENDFMNTVEKVMRSVHYVNSPYLMVYPDLGNITNGTEDILTDIETGRGYIVAAHLKETLPGKFREVPYGTGNVNFPAGIATLYEMGVRRYVAEFWHCGEESWGKVLVNNRRFLDEQFEKAKVLLPSNL
ncbi:L-ribulose-5-phosphate 3-epimerase [Clostridium sp. C105KSO13]|uniref:L-ribulose-5-phosphate 3-epimerase n=1 Tax=Clostridium sp. C105KSO13 TaxID=1776045 RepID=UPI00074075FC|nr:L-ribulose-5-phosphate 3-epimerase [Clostridium sp. C105KSO13]CUX29688.1 L-ribulose-5-phosphate 3-epimerase UlaE [Clostridium sp. C105KSO13]